MTFQFSLASVDKVLFEGEVFSVTAPGKSGELTLLAKHSPLITTLKEGEVRVRISEKKEDLHTFKVRGGLLEVALNRAIILI